MRRPMPKERLQGRSPQGARQPDAPADPLTVHPDIRRMLLTMRALTKGCRALSVWVAQQIDIAVRAPDGDERQRQRPGHKKNNRNTPPIKAESW
jgi:alkylation response protein AidB-like acyl-CoA dehydrogenase